MAGNEEDPLHSSTQQRSQQPCEGQTNISIFQRRKLRLQNCAKSHRLWKAQPGFKFRFCLALEFLHDSFPGCLESQRLEIWWLNWYLSCTSPPWVTSRCSLIQRQQIDHNMHFELGQPLCLFSVNNLQHWRPPRTQVAAPGTSGSGVYHHGVRVGWRWWRRPEGLEIFSYFLC